MSKAQYSLNEAQRLRGLGLHNGAASRAYYALFQAARAEFEAKPTLKPRNYPQDCNPRDLEEWTHAIVRNRGYDIGLQPAEMDLLKRAYALRIKADYRPTAVRDFEVDEILVGARALLVGLGVNL